jgi:hypothetical protein
LKIQKSNKAMPFGDMASTVVDDVQAVIWQGRTLVYFLSTAYDMQPENTASVERRCAHVPKVDKLFFAIVLLIWDS